MHFTVRFFYSRFLAKFIGLSVSNGGVVETQICYYVGFFGLEALVMGIFFFFFECVRCRSSDFERKTVEVWLQSIQKILLMNC